MTKAIFEHVCGHAAFTQVKYKRDEIRKLVESRLLEAAFPSVDEPAFEHMFMQSLSVVESW